MVKTKKQKQAVLDEALARFDRAEEAWREIYEAAREDIRFVDDPDGQWDEATKQKRQNQPCLTSDKVTGALRQVIGDHLQNKPGIKVIAAEDDDTDTAEIYEGLIRQIEARGKAAYKTAFKMAVKGGFGAWRIRHDYIASDSFEQDLILEEIKNPFSVLIDPVVQTSTLNSARYGFVFEDMSRDEFEAAYPKAQSTTSETFNTVGNTHNWIDKDNIRVAEYFRIVKEEKELGLTEDGQVLFVDEYPETPFIKTRKADVDRLELFKMTAMEILEEVECVGRYVPIVPLFGEQSNIDGKMITRGLVNKAKDPQRMLNYYVSATAEAIVVQPKAPFLYTPKMVKGHEKEWRDYATSNKPGLPYNPDAEAPGGRPERMMPPQAPSGLVQGIQLAAEDVKAATSIYDASLGARSNETSGRAIMARQQEGDVATYEFTDSFADSLQFTGPILVDMIPKVYDSQRMIRILGEDDAEKVMQVNKPVQNWQTGEWETVNDLSRGKYDIKVRIGPSYTTRRIETSEQIGQIIGQNPELGKMLGDIYVKSLDLVGGDEAVERIRKMLIKQGIAEPTEEEKQALMQQGTSPQAKAARELKQRAAQAEVAVKEATAREKDASAKLKAAQALAEQLEIQIKQQDIAGAMQTLQRMIGMTGAQIQ